MPSGILTRVKTFINTQVEIFEDFQWKSILSYQLCEVQVQVQSSSILWLNLSNQFAHQCFSGFNAASW